ncbi:hypothetical protein GGR55DRAFT_667744 [Xylaria sp. FL0064]|nr:hypothetical protein GGR55DRAFT_667744 [Xylaria sp. FL0064]
MRTNPLVAVLSGASSVSAIINAAAVRSQTPYSCNAVGGTIVTFEDDMSVMHTKFPDLYLFVDTPSHGFPPSYSIMDCITEAEYSEDNFGSGYSQARFAIANVTWSNNNLTLDKGDNFNTLRAKVDLNIEVSNETSPVHYPIGKDRYSANLVYLEVNPALGVNESYSGPFTFTASNPNPYVSFSNYSCVYLSVALSATANAIMCPFHHRAQPNCRSRLDILTQNCVVYAVLPRPVRPCP